jgi:hypothetical protein
LMIVYATCWAVPERNLRHVFSMASTSRVIEWLAGAYTSTKNCYFVFLRIQESVNHFSGNL